MGTPEPGLRTREQPQARKPKRAESSLAGGVVGIAAVTLATIALTAAGALVALVVALLF